MPYKITWIDEPWLMSVEYLGRVTYKDVEAVMKECIPQTEKHPTYYLIDISNTESFDPALLRSQSLMKLIRMNNAKLFAIVGVKGLFKFLVNHFRPFGQIKIFDHADEGRAFLEPAVAAAKQESSQLDTIPPA